MKLENHVSKMQSLISAAQKTIPKPEVMLYEICNPPIIDEPAEDRKELSSDAKEEVIDVRFNHVDYVEE
ncbi:unnamed protein product [Plasmodium vivax]|uniref:(malaria parasite P. vivax) hypothetical protein n=1 Tax=Plasmodium vivax TaxID=5855 RepID=A0A8S4HJ20_PLAVI|nr:unnamed protein product [Plasmodium vivax]